jgi:hypothetical protein
MYNREHVQKHFLLEFVGIFLTIFTKLLSQGVFQVREEPNIFFSSRSLNAIKMRTPQERRKAGFRAL